MSQLSRISVDASEIEINPEDIDNVVKKLNKGSAGGPDGMHMDVFCEIWRIRDDIDIRDRLVRFFDNLINSRIPSEIAKYVYSYKLIPVVKKTHEDGTVKDIRPICVPSVSCRIVQNLVISRCQRDIAKCVHPRQIAMG